MAGIGRMNALAQGAARMKLPQRTVCKACGERVRVTTKIAPMGGTHGLLVFTCVACEETEVVLVESGKWDEVVGRGDRADEA